MSTETKHEFPLIKWAQTKVGDRELELMQVIREKGRGFACAADTREEAWTGLVRCMAQAMDANMEKYGADPADAFTTGPTKDGADVIPRSMSRRLGDPDRAARLDRAFLVWACCMSSCVGALFVFAVVRLFG